jgi:hypothetical protein
VGLLAHTERQDLGLCCRVRMEIHACCRGRAGGHRQAPSMPIPSSSPSDWNFRLQAGLLVAQRQGFWLPRELHAPALRGKPESCAMLIAVWTEQQGSVPFTT